MSKGSFKFSDTDKGYKKVNQQLKELDRLVVTVGVHGDVGVHPDSEDGETVAEIGAAHEYGVGVPERSWLRSSFDKNERKLKIAMADSVKKIIKSRGKFQAYQATDFIGATFKIMIDQTIKSGIQPPISDFTARVRNARGYSSSTPPLVASGVFSTSILWKVRKGS